MKTIRKTLVVIDSEQSVPQLLEKAKLIATLSESHLHLLACNKTANLSSHLMDIQDALSAEGFSVSTEQAWDGCAHHTIIAVQQEQGCGLVMKQHQPDKFLSKALRTPDDWALLRRCPCPVLMIKGAIPWAGGAILAAVDAGATDTAHKILQAGVVGHSFDLSQLTGGSLHIISACPPPTLAAADPIYQVKESIHSYYHEQCRALQKEFGIDEAHLHIEEGPAEILIPGMAHRLGAAITVIGNVARSGLAGSLIGNTCEMILDALQSDILVLKPGDVIAHLEELAAPRLDESINFQARHWPYTHPPQS